jgi:hypothetical protein
MMNVIICGVVKNAAANLNNNIKLAMQLGSKCDKYKIVLYENNSTDSTKQILSEYKNKDNFEIIMEDFDSKTLRESSKIWAYTAVTGSHHPCRIEQISNARNKLRDELKRDVYAEYTYVVMVDFDAKFFLNDGILNSLYLVKENRKRVIYANSFDYYDYYALRSPHSGALQLEIPHAFNSKQRRIPAVQRSPDSKQRRPAVLLALLSTPTHCRNTQRRHQFRHGSSRTI